VTARATPEAKLFRDQWYGNAPFDPVAYGAKLLTVDHPKIRALAVRNVNGAPEYYLTPAERRAERDVLVRASADLEALHKNRTLDQLKTELDAPAGIEDLAQPGLARLSVYREAAVQREQQRLLEMCFRNHWSNNLIQADVDALVKADRLYEFTRRPRNDAQRAELEASGNHWLSEWNGYTPTAEEVNEWSLDGLAHDGINANVCIEARCEREGVPDTCPVCNGNGEHWTSPEAEAIAEAWEPQDPPKGDGYQLWETTSEGSPISPVFETLEALCDYAAEYCTTFGSFTATVDEWRQILDADFVHAKRGNAIFM